MVLLALLVAVSPGLAQSKKKEDDAKRRETGRELFGGGKGKSDDGTTGNKHWSIALEIYSGPQAAQAAAQRLAEVSIESGRTDVSIRLTERGAAIVAGAYPSPDDPQAREDLVALRSKRVGDRLPFAQAIMVPPVEVVDPGRVPELNLESAKSTFGARAQYTLQIAVYESAKRDEAKRAAEQAALLLRRDGELAYYYHGPQRSMVTVGVFSDADFDQRQRPKGTLLAALQERYPLNLLNGQYPIVEKVAGEPNRNQPSMLVRIP